MDSHVLEVQDAPGKCRKVLLDRYPFTIGRGPENNLVLSDVSVSRHHATIQRYQDLIAIVDNQSRNGVFVNRERVSGRRELHQGDVLRIGAIQLKLLPEQATVPLASRESGTLHFFPNRSSPDLIRTLSSRLPGSPQDRPSTRPPTNWEKLLRLLMEAPLPQMFETVFDTIEEAIRYDRSFLLLFQRGSPDQLRVLAQRVRKSLAMVATATSSEVLVSREVLRRVSRSREAVLVTREDESFVPTDSFILSGAGAALCFPLVARESVIGVLYLDRIGGSPGFSQKDVESLVPLVDLVALKVENFQLLEAYMSAQIDKRDLDIAETVQRDFFPEKLPRIHGYAIDGYTRPCRQVGGDFFDFMHTGDGELTMAMGDVSGKGLPSALYMVGVLTALRAHAEDGIELEALMGRIEKYVRASFRSDHFLTLFLGKLHGPTGRLRYVNAGHLPPLVLTSGGDMVELEGVDPALNVVPWQEFKCHEHQLAAGDLLFVYTDGLIEVEGRTGEQFGRERLLSCLRAQRGREPSLIRDRVLAALDSFASAEGHDDDKTMILVQRLVEGDPTPTPDLLGKSQRDEADRTAGRELQIP